MNTFKEHLYANHIQDIIQIGMIRSKNMNEGFDDIKAKSAKLIHKLGLHTNQQKGIIQYLTSFGSVAGKLMLAAIKGDTESVKKIIDTTKVTKEDFLDFLLRLDAVTMHFVTGPIHMIDAITGWHIWANIKDKTQTIETKISQTLKYLDDLKNSVSADIKKEFESYVNSFKEFFGLQK